ncbi:MAG: hypothetical protein IT324_04650 [Anaerolineae bacterium]|nr:hypothetical protein [Anaerolineae bacterium]
MELEHTPAVLPQIGQSTAQVVSRTTTTSDAVVSIYPVRIFWILSVIAVCLTLISFAGVMVYRHQLDDNSPNDSSIVKLIRRFDVRGESNTPSWYSGAILLLSAGILALIASDKNAKRDSQRWHWVVLAVLFVLFSLDEIASWHEGVSHVLDRLNPSGLFKIAWVIPALIFVIVVGLWYLPFILSLPAKIRRWIVLAAVLYITGALALEMIEGRLLEVYAVSSFTVITVNHLEDFLEMMGVVVFIFALLSYIKLYMNPISLTIHDA